MKQILLIFVSSVLIHLASVAEDAADWNAHREQVRKLRTELARQGAYAFVTNRTTTPPIAPYIHSQCWVDWLPRTNIEQIAYEQEKRDFGLDFFVAIEGLALPEIPLEDVDALEHHAEKMLTIAEWLKSADGYGNQILKKWSEGVALSAMGGMAVNSRCETNRISRLLARVDGVQQDIVRQVAILNEESPHRYKTPKWTTLVDVQKKMTRQWYPHQVETWKYYDKKDGRRKFTFDRTNGDPHEYAFYVPDRPPKGCSSVMEFWMIRKNHEVVCIYGLENRMAEEIRQILRFRSELGSFPKPTQEETKDLNLAFAYQSRLDDVWRKHTKGKEFHFLGAGAVVRIYGHTFVDWLTRALQLQREAGTQGKMGGK